jgi:hypothetical protein
LPPSSERSQRGMEHLRQLRRSRLQRRLLLWRLLLWRLLLWRLLLWRLRHPLLLLPRLLRQLSHWRLLHQRQRLRQSRHLAQPLLLESLLTRFAVLEPESQPTWS